MRVLRRQPVLATTTTSCFCLSSPRPTSSPCSAMALVAAGTSMHSYELTTSAVDSSLPPSSAPPISSRGGLLLSAVRAGDIDCQRPVPLASPAMGHWGTCPLSTSNNLFFSTRFWSRINVWRQSLMSNVFRILRTTVIRISLVFIWLKKWKGTLVFFVTRCISDPHFVLFYVCDLRYFDVVLCPSWRRHWWAPGSNDRQTDTAALRLAANAPMSRSRPS